MELEPMENNEPLTATASLLERLNAAAVVLEEGLQRMENRYSEMSGDVQRIVATVEGAENSLERRVAELEEKIAELQAKGASVAAGSNANINNNGTAGRKTLPSNTAALLAKQGISASETVETAALDAALNGLSIEQRIAVKSQLMRAGLLG